MLQRVMIDGIELPRLYIAENKADAELAMSKGIPFVRWRQGQEALIKMLLRPVLERMFPHIKWNKVLGPRKKFRTQVEVYKHDEDEVCDANPNAYGYDEEDDDIISEVSDIASNERLFSGGGDDDIIVEKARIEDYVGDMSSYVNIEMLQRLRLMPAFIGDILDCVKLNIGTGMYWREGYNKRLGIPVGRFDAARQLPNLVILDVSGSIPRGISATMISLIDTLRTQLSADLIITGSISRFYAMGEELPSPQTIRNQFGFGNEADGFYRILSTRIRGKHYGHVFSFGDNDTPEYFSNYWDTYKKAELDGIIVEHVHHYHTYQDKTPTGYAKWCHMLSKQPRVDYDTEWCKVIFK